MFDRIIFIMTVLTCGICAGVTLGAMYISVLPVWLGLMVITGCSFIAYEGCTSVR